MWKFSLVVLATFLLWLVPSFSGEFTAKVISVADGDTLTVLGPTETLKIRLNGIDAPERGQSFSDRSKSLLNVLCRNKVVEVRTFDKDRSGIWTADIVLAPSRSVNQEMVRQGLAWHYKKCSNDPILARLEAEARSAKKGLWKDAKPLAPWDWRDNPSLRPTPTPVPTPLPLSPVYQSQVEADESLPSAAPAPSGYVSPPEPAPSYGGYNSGSSGRRKEWGNVKGYTRKDGTYVRPHRRRTH